jgi:hypothetical protein
LTQLETDRMSTLVTLETEDSEILVSCSVAGGYCVSSVTY